MIAAIKLWVGANQALAYGAAIVALVLSLWGAKALYDASVRSKVIDEIIIQEKVIKDGAIKRVEKSDSKFDAVDECDVLSWVFDTDQCPRGPDAPAEDIPPSGAAEGADPPRTGPHYIGTSEAEVPPGSFFQDETLPNLCPHGWVTLDQWPGFVCTDVE